MRSESKPRACLTTLKTVERSRCTETHYEREKR